MQVLITVCDWRSPPCAAGITCFLAEARSPPRQWVAASGSPSAESTVLGKLKGNQRYIKVAVAVYKD